MLGEDPVAGTALAGARRRARMRRRIAPRDPAKAEEGSKYAPKERPATHKHHRPVFGTEKTVKLSTVTKAQQKARADGNPIPGLESNQRAGEAAPSVTHPDYVSEHAQLQGLRRANVRNCI